MLRSSHLKMLKVTVAPNRLTKHFRPQARSVLTRIEIPAPEIRGTRLRSFEAHVIFRPNLLVDLLICRARFPAAEVVEAR